MDNTHHRTSPDAAVQASEGGRNKAVPRPTQRVLLVDDHAAFRNGLRSLMEEYSDVKVIGEAADGEEAVALVRSLHPDMVLMDVQLPRMNGVEATRRIRRLSPAPVVIGLSVHWNPTLEAAMSAAGAACYLSKTDAADRLHQVMVEVANRPSRRPAGPEHR